MAQPFSTMEMFLILQTHASKVYKTGHMAFYDDEGRRFLGTDPGGHPLHEAKWSKDPVNW